MIQCLFPVPLPLRNQTTSICTHIDGFNYTAFKAEHRVLQINISFELTNSNVEERCCESLSCCGGDTIIRCTEVSVKVSSECVNNWSHGWFLFKFLNYDIWKLSFEDISNFSGGGREIKIGARDFWICFVSDIEHGKVACPEWCFASRFESHTLGQ